MISSKQIVGLCLKSKCFYCVFDVIIMKFLFPLLSTRRKKKKLPTLERVCKKNQTFEWILLGLMCQKHTIKLCSRRHANQHRSGRADIFSLWPFHCLCIIPMLLFILHKLVGIGRAEMRVQWNGPPAVHI